VKARRVMQEIEGLAAVETIQSFGMPIISNQIFQDGFDKLMTKIEI
jgi:hypothetical protein